MNTLKLISNHTKKLIPLAMSTLNPQNATVLFRNLSSNLKGQTWIDYVNKNSLKYDDLIHDALGWIKHSQDVIGSGGVGCYEFYRWTKGYPEVTGYIIPTVWDCHHYFNDEDAKTRAVRMTDWELGIQKEGGGWEGFYEGDGQPPVIFNTGQVLRGLIRTYRETNDKKYLDAAIRAADWVIDTQDEDGSWTKTNFKQMKRVYDTYVTAPLADLYTITKKESYKAACIKNCDFVLENQHENGWFEKADNTLLNNEAPVLHTISYTIDGLIETGIHLEMDKYINAGKLAADALLHKAEISDMMPARMDNKWKTRSSYSCMTGNAQLGIIFMRLYKLTDDKRYVNAALKLADFLAYTQKLNAVGAHRKGGITGSYPIWGMYCPLKYPSWATKYYIDLLFMLKKLQDLTSINKEQLSEQIAYITINPRGNFLKSAQQGFQDVGVHPKFLVYVKPTDRLWKELKKYKLSFFGRFLVPQLKRFMGNKKSFSNEVVEIKIPVTKTIPKLNSDELMNFLKENNIKYLINCGAGIFRKKVISVPGVTILNAHAGKLPEYKNMNVVEWAICNGDTPHGTIHRIDVGIDTGPVWYEEPIDVKGTKSLTEARELCFDKVIKMMGSTVVKNEEGTIVEKKHAPNQGRKWYRMHSYFQNRVDNILNQ